MRISKTTTEPDLTSGVDAADAGWYLYGVTLTDVAAQFAAGQASVQNEPLLVIEQGELAAVAQIVRRDAFSSETIQEHAQDIGWLEDVVRRHNMVVEQMHRCGVVAPARFGSVYPDRELLQANLVGAYSALLSQLQWLRGCDEWGVHLYADSQAQVRAASADPAIQQLQAEIAAASPGRAYLLKRKLVDAMASVSEAALDALAHSLYPRLAEYAVAGQRNPASSQPAGDGAECEALYASFLVKREATEDFLRTAQRLVQEQDGLRCESSGPWPPYSFASVSGGKDDDE